MPCNTSPIKKVRRATSGYAKTLPKSFQGRKELAQAIKGRRASNRMLKPELKGTRSLTQYPGNVPKKSIKKFKKFLLS